MNTIGKEGDLRTRSESGIACRREELGLGCWYSRFLRSSMLDVCMKNYIRTARAKGARWVGAL